VYAVKERLNWEIERTLNGVVARSRSELLTAGLLLDALRSIEQVEKERDAAVDVIMAVEDVVYHAKSAAVDAVPYLTPIVNITKIEKALGREQDVPQKP
jgi:uncharacterized protein (UPF0335 family)